MTASAHQHYALSGVVPEARIGAPARRRRKSALKSLVLGMATLAAGYGSYEYQDIWMPLAREAYSTVSASIQNYTSMAAPPSPVALAPPPPPVPKSTSEPRIEPPPPVASTEPVPLPVKVESQPAKLEPVREASAAQPPIAVSELKKTAAVAYAAPPAHAPEKDGRRQRAEAAGLHPDLSRVVLAKLSDADFRNARMAIDKALTETANDAVYVWPRQKKADLAIFKVHFVSGAGDNCRRYVVTIAKDGWLHTALPMEKCGVQVKALER